MHKVGSYSGDIKIDANSSLCWREKGAKTKKPNVLNDTIITDHREAIW